MLSECIVQLGKLGADRHVLEARINLALVAARRFHFNNARELMLASLEHALNRFDQSVLYRILYNLSIVELALENYTSARKQILRMLDLREFKITAAQLGAVQTMLAAVELVLEGPQVCAGILRTAAQNMPAYTAELDLTYTMLGSLCRLAEGDVESAKLEADSALRRKTGTDIAVYTRIIHSCLLHLVHGRKNKYEPLGPAEASYAQELAHLLKQSSPEIFEVIHTGA
jgi:hypothetical protein